MLHKDTSLQVVKPSLCPCLPKTLNPEPNSTVTSNAAMFKHSLTCMPPSPEANFSSTQMTRHSLICIRCQILYSMMFEEETKLFNTSHNSEKLGDLQLGTHLHISSYNSNSHFHEICWGFMTTPSISATKFIAHKFIANKLGETIHSLYIFFFCVILRGISLK